MSEKAVFVVLEKPGKNYSFQLVHGDKQVLLEGDLYPIYQACISAIVACKLHAGNERNFRRKKRSDGLYYFSLSGTVHESLGVSIGFKDIKMRNEQIALTKRLAPTAQISEIITA